MKNLTNLAAFIALVFIFTSSLHAQDPDIERLQKITAIIGKVNALRVDFAVASPALTAAGIANVKKQAELLKQLPTGTVVEIGVHTFAIGNEAANVKLTQARAEKIRSALIAAGVAPSGLTALGYGSSKPLTSDPANDKNRRVEYLVTKAGTAAPATRSTTNQNTASSKPEIVAGIGWRNARIGSSQTEVESSLGKPEFFETSSFPPRVSYGSYYKKGVVVVYDPQTKRVITLRFIGDGQLYGTGSVIFQSFEGKPDKGLAWKSSEAQVVAVYGAPVKREAYNAYKSMVEIVNLYYPGIHFIFKGGQLFQINIEAGAASTQNPPTPVEKAKTPVVIALAKTIDNLARW